MRRVKNWSPWPEGQKLTDISYCLAYFIVAADTDGEICLNAGPLVEHTCINCPTDGNIHIIAEDPIDSGLVMNQYNIKI